MGVGVPSRRLLDPAEPVFRDLGLSGEQVNSALVQFGKLLPSVRVFK
jgi:hypothetical protein